MSTGTGEAIVATKGNVESTDLIVVPGDEYALVDHKRRAHICCGCDTRNAVFVVNSIGFCYYLLMVVSYSLLVGDTPDYDDDAVQSGMNFLHEMKVGTIIIIFSVGLFCNITALFGAKFFNKFATWIGGMWFLTETVLRVLRFDFAGAGIALCFCYPHAVFYYELKNGVMSRENYPNEKICCDCLFTC